MFGTLFCSVAIEIVQAVILAIHNVPTKAKIKVPFTKSSFRFFYSTSTDDSEAGVTLGV